MILPWGIPPQRRREPGAPRPGNGAGARPARLREMQRGDSRSDVPIGGECAACGRAVPVDAARVLASREDLVFAELPCSACGTTSLSILVGPASSPVGDAVGPDDVLDMHLFLAAWSGDLRSLVSRPAGDATGPA